MLCTALGESIASLDSTTRSDLCTHYCLGVSNTLAVMPSLFPIYLLLLIEHKWDCLESLPELPVAFHSVCSVTLAANHNHSGTVLSLPHFYPV